MHIMGLQERFSKGEALTNHRMSYKKINFYGGPSSTHINSCSKHNSGKHPPDHCRKEDFPSEKSNNCHCFKLYNAEGTGEGGKRTSQQQDHRSKIRKGTQTVHWKFKQINKALKHTEVTSHPHLQEFPQQTVQKTLKKKN